MPHGPNWVVEIARPVRGAMPWSRMARAALGVGVPVAAGLVTGGTVPGVLVALGGLAGAVSERPGHYPERSRWGAIAGVGGAVGVAVGIAGHGTGWPAAVVLVLAAAASVLLSALGSGWSPTGFCLLAFAILGSGPLGALQPRWLPVPLLLAGTCWALLLLAVEWLLRSRTLRLPGWALRPRTVPWPAWGLRPKTVRWPEPVLRSWSLRLPEPVLRSWTARRPMWVLRSRIVRLPGWVARTSSVPLPAAEFGSRTLRLPEWATRSRIIERPPPRVDGAAGASVDAIRRGGGLRRGVSALVREAGPTFSAVSCVRLMLCVAVAAVLTEMVPLGRSYWVVLAVALVMRPELGSISARVPRYAAGTLIGGAVGALLLAVGLPEAAVLAALVLLAALLPFGTSRGYGLFVLLLTPLILLLIDTGTGVGWRVAAERLIDILLGCVIALGIGYVPWPRTWHANLPRAFARAVDGVADYLDSTLPTSTEASTATAQARAHKELAALRMEFRRAMARPEPGSDGVPEWRLAADALERVLDSVTAIRTGGEEPPSPAEVAVLNDELRQIAAAAGSGRSAPHDLSPINSPALGEVTRSVQGLARAVDVGTLR